MVNFALDTMMGFKLTRFSKVCLLLCCSKITTEKLLLNSWWAAHLICSKCPDLPPPPWHLWLVFVVWFIKWLIVPGAHCLSAMFGAGLLFFPFPEIGKRYWLETSHMGQKLPNGPPRRTAQVSPNASFHWEYLPVANSEYILIHLEPSFSTHSLHPCRYL